ncbi:MAG TPA: hypothetical protein VMS00_15010, partial [Acidimicrobiales bacterium]|nr:hypothetical protein [Acidimicrobiales bacterium]
MLKRFNTEPAPDRSRLVRFEGARRGDLIVPGRGLSHIRSVEIAFATQDRPDLGLLVGRQGGFRFF